MELNYYDEFGNYIGPELGLDSENDSSLSDDEAVEGIEQGACTSNSMVTLDHDYPEKTTSSIVLHEDKKYYPDAGDVYGEAEVLVMEEDHQPIEKPIIQPVEVKSFSVLESDLPQTKVCTNEIMV